MTDASAHVRVRDWVDDLGALEPGSATRLAQHVIDRSVGNAAVVVDFQGVGTITSGFANAFFLELAETRPLDEWRRIVQFTGLAPRQAQILAKSLQAARDALEDRPGPSVAKHK
jgi:hypothetical protein